jgi:hypothetical protein
MNKNNNMKPTRKSRYRLESERVKELEKQRIKFKEKSSRRFSRTNKSLPKSIYKQRNNDISPKPHESPKEKIHISLLWRLKVGLEKIKKNVVTRKFIDPEQIKENVFEIEKVRKLLQKNLEKKLMSEFLSKLEMIRLSHLSEYLQEEKSILRLQKQKTEAEVIILRKKCKELERKNEWVLKEFKETEKNLKKRIKEIELERENSRKEVSTQEKLIEEMRKDIVDADSDFIKMGSIIQGLEDRLKENKQKHLKQMAELRSNMEREKDEMREEHWKELELKNTVNKIKEKEEARIERAGVVLEMQKMLKQKENKNEDLRKGVEGLEEKINRVINENKQLMKEKQDIEDNFINLKEKENLYLKELEKQVKEQKKQIKILKDTLLKSEDARERQAKQAQKNFNHVQVLKGAVLGPGESEKKFQAEKISLETNLEILRGKNRELENLVLQLTEERELINQQMEKVHKELKVKSLSTYSEDRSAENHFFYSEKQKAEETLRFERKEKDLLEIKLREMELEVKRLKLEIESQINDKNKIQKEFDEKNETAKKLENIVGEQKGNMQMYEAELSRLRGNLMILEGQKRISDTKIDQLEREKGINKIKVEELMGSLEKKNTLLNTHLKEIQILKEKYLKTLGSQVN